MFVTCPFCYKVFSIKIKIENYTVVDCPLCSQTFELNLNGIKVIGDGEYWITSEHIENIYIGGFYDGTKYDEYQETISEIKNLLGDIVDEPEVSENTEELI